MYRVAVIDDEVKDRAMVLQCIQQQFPEMVCVTFSSTQQFLGQEENFDALFLDIDMPDNNGIVFAGTYQKIKPDTLIIFVSWHDDLIFEGMKLLPFTFVRKNHLEADMKACIKNVTQRLQKRDQTWTLQQEHAVHQLMIRDIQYFEQMENYCIVYLISGKQLEFRCSMTKLAVELSKFQVFIQISRGYIVNMQHIHSCRNKRIVMKQGLELEISRRRWTQCHETWIRFQMDTIK